MLRKLLKHEFRATARIMLPLYLVLLVTAVGANITTQGLSNSSYQILRLLGALLAMAFGVAIIGVCVMSLVVMVQRFYKNLLGDEGYVMLTLPVNLHQQVWSKLIVSAVWFAATFLAVVLAALMVSFNVGSLTVFFRGIGELLEQLTAYYALNGAAMAVEFLAMCFFGCCAMCLHFYASLAVGHSFPTHKMAWSVLWFFVFSFAAQFLFGTAMVVLDETGLAEWMFRTVDAWVLTPMAPDASGLRDDDCAVHRLRSCLLWCDGCLPQAAAESGIRKREPIGLSFFMLIQRYRPFHPRSIPPGTAPCWRR